MFNRYLELTTDYGGAGTLPAVPWPVATAVARRIFPPHRLQQSCSAGADETAAWRRCWFAAARDCVFGACALLLALGGISGTNGRPRKWNIPRASEIVRAITADPPMSGQRSAVAWNCAMAPASPVRSSGIHRRRAIVVRAADPARNGASPPPSRRHSPDLQHRIGEPSPCRTIGCTRMYRPGAVRAVDDQFGFAHALAECACGIIQIGILYSPLQLVGIITGKEHDRRVSFAARHRLVHAVAVGA